MLDFILNGQGHGSIAGRMASPDWQPGMQRAWISPKNGRTYITINRFNPRTGKMEKVYKDVTANAPLALPRDSWKMIDYTVQRAALPRLKVVNQMRAAGLEFNVPNGFGTMALESYVGGDITGATISMGGNRRGDFDRPELDTRLLPLPIIHKDFNFEARQIAASRRSGVPLDTTTATLAARKVAEEIEKLTIGVSDFNGYSFGGGTVYGLLNHPSRLTKTLTNPATNADWTPETTVNEVLQMIEQARVAGYYGPFRLLMSPGWGVYLDADYSAAKGTNTLRQRLLAIEPISGIDQADYLSGSLQIALVSQDEATARIVVGMDVTTLIWETMGGMEVNFKVMAIMVPQVRADANNKAGIVHGTVAA
jgi:uncharacterized linocin/CFP29 family protein